MPYSPSIQSLIRAFSKLPGVGTRTAERFVFFLLKSGRKHVAELTQALNAVMQEVKSCDMCWDFSDTTPCRICSNTTRERTRICVVSQSQDVQVFEHAGMFRGLYHILRGTLKPEEEDSANNIKIHSLLERVQNGSVEEVILALNPDMDGEITMMFLEKELKKTAPHIRVTRLARGLPMGSDVQYADDVTLQNAFTYRTEKPR